MLGTHGERKRRKGGGTQKWEGLKEEMIEMLQVEWENSEQLVEFTPSPSSPRGEDRAALHRSRHRCPPKPSPAPTLAGAATVLVAVARVAVRCCRLRHPPWPWPLPSSLSCSSCAKVRGGTKKEEGPEPFKAVNKLGLTRFDQTRSATVHRRCTWTVIAPPTQKLHLWSDSRAVCAVVVVSTNSSQSAANDLQQSLCLHTISLSLGNLLHICNMNFSFLVRLPNEKPTKIITLDLWTMFVERPVGD
ncbi:hypothetical protein Taro_029948 [Colocasia esculenta]|uniref:Uncharacterized protein n=1 Tax=Colocasia esculenta TaxID=4460 RepID=A0A843VUQ4_COLES|nr:hypothetical protein [Colocasia esculenta]